MSTKALVTTNAFAVLGVSTRDDRQRILQALEERSLLSDPDACQQAYASLINPRKRLDSELAWFPGVSPSTAHRAWATESIDGVDELPLAGLTKANCLIVAGLRAQSRDETILTNFLSSMVSAVESIDLDQLFRDLNEDRQIAGIPPLASEEVLAEALNLRRQVWRQSVLDILGYAQISVIAGALTTAVQQTAPRSSFIRFLSEIVDDYAVRLLPFMQKETEGLQRLCAKAREVAGAAPNALVPIIAAIEGLLSNWQKLTYPVQVCATVRGQKDADSERVAYTVRSLSVDLYNEHRLARESRQLAEMVRSKFSRLPGIASKIDEDLKALDRLAGELRKKQAELSYAADIGLFGKSRLAIDAEGLEWKGRRYELSKIRGARWGGLSRSVNGIPTGTEYLIAWSDGQTSEAVQLRNKAVFQAFVGKLFRALADPIIGKMIAELQDGSTIRVGNALIRDRGVVLRRRKLLGSEPVELGWEDVTTRSRNGEFTIEGPRKSNASISISYRDYENVHFLEALVRTALDNRRARLSDAFAIHL